MKRLVITFRVVYFCFSLYYFYANIYICIYIFKIWILKATFYESNYLKAIKKVHFLIVPLLVLTRFFFFFLLFSCTLGYAKDISVLSKYECECMSEMKALPVLQ